MVIGKLAREYQQLYLKPGTDTADSQEYREIVRKGKEAGQKDLSHFYGSEKDMMYEETTPAGKIRIVFLECRADFETFLQIMMHRCHPIPIPKSIGAMTISGLANWEKIKKHKEQFLKDHMVFEWGQEFKRFTSNPENFKETLIVLSEGPYSNLSAAEAGCEQNVWREKSRVIRKYHECTHVICRRQYPDLRDAIWDEIAADCIGLLAAYGTYDAFLAGKLLGVAPNGYIGGRMENYWKLEENEKKQRAAENAWTEICRLKRLVQEKRWSSPYDLIPIFMEDHWKEKEGQKTESNKNKEQ